MSNTLLICLILAGLFFVGLVLTICLLKMVKMDEEENFISGELSLDDEPWKGNHLQMHFDFHGGGKSKVLAILSSKALPVADYAASDYVVFFIDDQGRIEDYCIGQRCFFSGDDRDWRAMRPQVQEIWESVSKND